MNLGFFRAILSPTHLKRFLFFYLADTALIACALYLSFLIHLDFNLNVDYAVLVLEVAPFFVAVKLVVLSIFRVYRLTWRYVGIVEMMNLTMALVIGELILTIWSLTPSLSWQLPIYNMSRRIFLVDGILSLCLLGGLRMSKRLYIEVIRGRGHLKSGKRSIIVGAGNTGYMILKDMTQQEFSGFHPVAFLDDNPSKVGTYIGGVKVAGTTETLKEAIARTGAEAVLIAIPSLNHKKLRGLYDTAKELNIGTIKVLPRIYDFDKPNINLKTLEDISIEDLIGRQSVSVDVKGIEGFIEGRSVLITGAGGSIGSEIAKQVATFDPGRLVLFDIDETELHNLGLKLRRYFPAFFVDRYSLDKGGDFLQSAFRIGRVLFVTGDIRDRRRMAEVFAAYRPEIVFHAAAYKHVPMMEFNPEEAVKVNILGTRELARASVEWGVEKFIMISTDKAVRPTSVMGATKRMAEYICRAYDEEARGNRIGEPENRRGGGGEDRIGEPEDRRTGAEETGTGAEEARIGGTENRGIGAEKSVGEPENRSAGAEEERDGVEEASLGGTEERRIGVGVANSELSHQLPVTSYRLPVTDDDRRPTIDHRPPPGSEAPRLRGSEASVGGTRFISVRFGNVLGSRGSVLPLFLEQLQHGGPLTVTHREMRRYFMTIPEAVSLVLQASTMGVGGEVFVLDMGEPVKVVELAEELIRIHGMEPYRDVDIEFTGLRPGEKLFEEILTAEEGTVASRHEKVFVARESVGHSVEEINGVIGRFEELLEALPTGAAKNVQDLLRQYVPYYDVGPEGPGSGGDK